VLNGIGEKLNPVSKRLGYRGEKEPKFWPREERVNHQGGRGNFTVYLHSYKNVKG